MVSIKYSRVSGFVFIKISMILSTGILPGSSRFIRYGSLLIPMLSPMDCASIADISLPNVSFTFVPKHALITIFFSSTSSVIVLSSGTTNPNFF